MLRRFWFKTRPGLGYGVTASSRGEAEQMLSEYSYPRSGEVVVEVIENIDVRTLDQKHVIPNAGPSAVRGIWFPFHNI